MAESPNHTTKVTQWFASRDADDLSALQLAELLHLALVAVWQRAYLTLGEITLAAIFDRVLYSGRAHYGWLGALTIGPKGPELDARKLKKIPDNEALAASVYLLAELLTVLGNLTAEILTPELYKELEKVSLSNNIIRNKPGKAPRPAKLRVEGKGKKGK